MYYSLYPLTHIASWVAYGIMGWDYNFWESEGIKYVVQKTTVRWLPNFIGDDIKPQIKEELFSQNHHQNEK